MDFFQAQETARRKSKLLVFYYACALVLIIAVVYFVGLFAISATQGDPEGYRPPFRLWRPDVLAFAAGGSLAIIVGGSLFKTLSLRSGGGVVAKSVGGTLVSPDTTDPRLQRLRNIVEEMAIASGIRVPEIYVLPEAGINAFAAGFSPDDAAVAVTEGALDTLNRDELQGVIAHEFSHILNGDMRLNIRLIGLLFGILLLAIIGRGFFHSIRFGRLSGGRNKNSGGIMLALLAMGLALIIVGYVGVLFGRLIQAAVSRQREFLADASAVQFTRNPQGISGALKKIGGLAAGSQITSTHAAETGHLFFANALRGSAFNLFATHPPLVERIRAIDPSFDGNFKAATLAARAVGRSEAAAPTGRRQTPPPLQPEQFVSGLASVDIADAAAIGSHAIASIPVGLREAAHDPARVRAVVLALLCPPGDTATAVRQKHALIEALSAPERESIPDIQSELARLPASARLPLLDLSLPTLRHLPPEQLGRFLESMQSLVEADGKTTLFEFALQQIVTRNLTGRNEPAPGTQVVSFNALANEMSAVLSLIAHAGSNDPGSVQSAFTAGASQLGLVRNRLALLPESRVTPESLRKALGRLGHGAPPIKRQLLEAMARAAAIDGVIMPGEAETLRAIAAAIDCPAPPLAP
ncbi:MAG: M48 family metallopeptidase [Opitutaceae bacterium]